MPNICPCIMDIFMQSDAKPADQALWLVILVVVLHALQARG